jgi:hypothetical protein
LPASSLALTQLVLPDQLGERYLLKGLSLLGLISKAKALHPLDHRFKLVLFIADCTVGNTARALLLILVEVARDLGGRTRKKVWVDIE